MAGDRGGLRLGDADPGRASFEQLGARTWTVNGRTCSAGVPKTAHGGTAEASDTTYPASGSATFLCGDTAWNVQAGATCNPGCAGQATS